MKKIILSVGFLFSVASLQAAVTKIPVAKSARTQKDAKNTEISEATITYSQLVGQNQAIIGGQVAFAGPGPVFVTVRMGGQSFTQPVDFEGFFSFFVFTNGDGQFEYSAWTTDAPLSEGNAGMLKASLK